MDYILILAAIALMCILSYKGMPIIPVTVVCSLLVGFLLDGGPAAALSQSFLPGFSGYAGNMFLLFVFGGLFGNRRRYVHWLYTDGENRQALCPLYRRAVCCYL